MDKPIFCPECGHIHTPILSNISWSLPPTGGDYEWVETEAQATCKNCSHRFEVRVQIDIDSNQVNKIVYFPYPASAIIFAMIEDLSYAVKILKLFDNAESAQKAHSIFIQNNSYLASRVYAVEIHASEIFSLDGKFTRKKKYDFESLSFE